MVSVIVVNMGSDNGLVTTIMHIIIDLILLCLLFFFTNYVHPLQNFNRNASIFIEENIMKMSSAKWPPILSRLQWVKQDILQVSWHHRWVHFTTQEMALLTRPLSIKWNAKRHEPGSRKLQGFHKVTRGHIWAANSCKQLGVFVFQNKFIILTRGWYYLWDVLVCTEVFITFLKI